MKLTKKIVKEIEQANTGCTVEIGKEYITVYVDNRCGEDFQFDVENDSLATNEIISYCENFDPEEHAAMWYGANRGEPSSLRALLDNSDEIAENLDKLAEVLYKY